MIPPVQLQGRTSPRKHCNPLFVPHLKKRHILFSFCHIPDLNLSFSCPTQSECRVYMNETAATAYSEETIHRAVTLRTGPEPGCCKADTGESNWYRLFPPLRSPNCRPLHTASGGPFRPPYAYSAA